MLNVSSEELNDLYFKFGKWKKVAEHLGVCEDTITEAKRRNGLRINKKKYKFDERFFEEINNDKKAYFLGFISADGCVIENANRQSRLTVSISKKDIEILERFKSSIGTKKPILKYGDMANLFCTSDKMCSDLKRYNMNPRHKETYYPKNIPEKYFWQFLKGFFDADGSISCGFYKGVFTGPPSGVKISIGGNLKAAGWFYKELTTKGLFVSTYERNKSTSYKIADTVIKRVFDKYCFSKKIVETEPKGLARKEERFMSYIEKVESSNNKTEKEAVKKYKAWRLKNG